MGARYGEEGEESECEKGECEKGVRAPCDRVAAGAATVFPGFGTFLAEREPPYPEVSIREARGVNLGQGPGASFTRVSETFR